MSCRFGESVLLMRVALAAFGLLLTGPAGAAAPSQPVRLLKLSHHDDIVKTVVMTRARFLLDGVLLAEKTQAPATADGTWFESPLEPGPHVLSVELIYNVTGSFFDYINGYRFIATGQLHFDAPGNIIVEVTTSSSSQLDLTLPWADRFRFRLQATPREIVTQASTDVRVASPTESFVEMPIGDPSNAAESQRLLALEEAAIQEVLDSAAVVTEAAPPPPPQEAPAAPPPAPLPPSCDSHLVRFGHNQWQVSEEEVPSLQTFFRCATERGAVVKVVGHTDNTGASDYNARLSLQRAQAVAKVLRREPSGARVRLKVDARGQQSLLCLDDSEECRAMNRRVEVTLIPVSRTQAVTADGRPSFP